MLNDILYNGQYNSLKNQYCATLPRHAVAKRQRSSILFLAQEKLTYCLRRGQATANNVQTFLVLTFSYKQSKSNKT